ncbi:MAG: nucleotidyltransferase domain-containing protein, partial [Vicinamibacterales bacterium]
PTSNHERENTEVVQLLRRTLGEVIAVYRFGSTAHGNAVPSSDVDIAVLPCSPLAPNVRFDAQEQLAVLLGRDVDLVDLRAASPVLAVQVLGSGQLIHDGDAVNRGAFEDRALGAYARLNEERRGILARVAAEGTVYGR